MEATTAKPRKPRAPKSAVSLAAHRRTVKACELMGLPYRRPDHPSVKRLLAAWKQQSRRNADPDLRRLIDLWRETEPEAVGLLARYGSASHRCAMLGNVLIGGMEQLFGVTVCKRHKRQQPTTADYAHRVGADWLRANLPDVWLEWRKLAYTPANLPPYMASRRSKRVKSAATPQPYTRVVTWIVPQVQA